MQTVDAIKVRGLEDVHHAARARAEQLNVSREDIDELAGLTGGLSSKLLCDPPLSRMGWQSAPKLLAALGLKLIIAEDHEQCALMRPYWGGRQASVARTVPIGPSPWERAGELRRAQCRKAGRIRMRQLSRPERQALARRAAKALNASLTARQRSENARKAALSRWSRRMPASEQARIEMGA
jgi:hypothetical protein